jgi:glycosyltransferase involved in cell wall biosynthesis
MVLAANEEANIARCLGRLQWARRVVVVDSLSTDATPAICAGFPNVTRIERAFDSLAGQANFGLDHIDTAWVLSLDADYVVSRGFADALSGLDGAAHAGFRSRFRYCVFGRPLRASLYPPRCVLYRRDSARYGDDGHAHRVSVQGLIGWLDGSIDHDDRKPFARWVANQSCYARLEARKLGGGGALRPVDRLRQAVVVAPWLNPLYTLVAKGLLWAGPPGYYYVLQRAAAECLIAIAVLDERLRKETP